MTLNAQITDELVQELAEIMNGEKDRNQAPKSTKRNNKKDNRKEG